MGRVKLKIKRLENMNGRQATYAKRKNGIMKKANELAILCDIKIILLMFSPTGKPSLCRGNHSIEDVIEKFAKLSPQERAKRKLESLEVLKKTFQKLDHEVNISEFLGTSSQAIEDLTSQARLLQSHLSEVHKRLSYWTNLDKINNIEHLGQMENSLRDSVNRIRAHKENLGNQQLMSLDCNNQFQNGMHVSFRMIPEQQLQNPEQQLQNLQWMTNGELQQVVLPEDPNNLPHRDVECSGSSSFGSYPGYFNTGKPSEMSTSGPESGVNDFFSELNGAISPRLQLSGQSYIPYNLNLLTDVKYNPPTDMSVQESPVNFHLNGSFEPPKPDFDSTPCSWPSASGPCVVNMFEERLFSRQQN